MTRIKSGVCYDCCNSLVAAAPMVVYSTVHGGYVNASHFAQRPLRMRQATSPRQLARLQIPAATTVPTIVQQLEV